MKTGHASLKGMPACAVIGAGVLGLCSAIQAQRKGYRVTLYDRQPPGKGASYGNAGYLACELIDPLATPETLRQAPRLWLDPDGPLALPLRHLPALVPWLLRFVASARPKALAESRKALRALNEDAVPAWTRLLAPLGLTQHLVKSGYMLVWESDAKREQAKTHADYLARFNIQTQWLDKADLVSMEPEMGPQLSHGLFFPNAWRVQDPYMLVEALYAAFLQEGGRFCESAVERVLPTGNGQAQVRSEEEAEVFDRAIICAGAWSSALLEPLGLSVPLEAERGYHLTYPNKRETLNYPMGSAERRFVMTPLASGLRVVGMSELGGLKLSPFKRRYKVLKKHARALIPSLKGDSEPCETWMGHRPTLPDSLPVLDCHPEHPQIGFAFGNQHLGLTQAAISSELLWYVLDGESAPVDMAPYRVTRF